MYSFLRQATDSQSRLIGPFVDSSDGVTLKTGLTIANTDIKLSMNGGTASNKNSGGATSAVNGCYAVTFNATDTADVGELAVTVNVSGALVVIAKYTVLEEAVYDRLFAASAAGYAVPGSQMDLVSDPNASAVSAIQLGLSTLTASQVWGHATRTLSEFAFTVDASATSVRGAVGLSSNNLDSQLTAINDKTTNLPLSPAATGDAMTLTSGERTAIATTVEAALINEGDGQQLIDAIIQVINSSLDIPTLELTAIGNAVRTALATELGRIDASISSRATPGAQMDLVNTPNATAVSAFQNGLSTLTASQVWSNTTRTLSAFSFTPSVNGSSIRSAVGLASANLDTQLSGISSKTSNLPASPAATGAAMTLTSAERTSVATVVEAALLNEGDGQQLIDAIIQMINSSLDIPALELTAIGNAVRTALATELGRIDVSVSSRAAPGAEMDLVSSPNSTAVAAITNGIPAAVWGYSDRQLSAFAFSITVSAGSIRDAVGMTAANLDSQLNSLGASVLTRAAPGAKMDLVDAPNATAIAEIQDGIPDAVDTTLTNSHGSGSWQQTAASEGSGARTVAIKVNDEDSDPIAGATVRLTVIGGSGSYVGTTDASGDVSFSLDDGSYTVSITKPYYTFTPVTLAVSTNTTQTYEMSTLAVTLPTSPLLCAVSILCLSSAGAVESGVTVNFQLVNTPPQATGFAASSVAQTAVSDANGYVQFDAIRGGRYQVWREGQPERQRFVTTLPEDQSLVTLPAIIGP